MVSKASSNTHSVYRTSLVLLQYISSRPRVLLACNRPYTTSRLMHLPPPPAETAVGATDARIVNSALKTAKTLFTRAVRQISTADDTAIVAK